MIKRVVSTPGIPIDSTLAGIPITSFTLEERIEELEKNLSSTHQLVSQLCDDMSKVLNDQGKD